jgi:hypothetical protein
MERFQLLKVLHLNHPLAFFGLDHESKISLHRKIPLILQEKLQA